MAERGFSNEIASQAGFPTSPELAPQRKQMAGEHRPNTGSAGGGDLYHQPALGIGPQSDGQQFRTKQRTIDPGVASFLRTHSLGVGARNLVGRMDGMEQSVQSIQEMQQKATDSLARSMQSGGSRPPANPQYWDASGGGDNGNQAPQPIPTPIIPAGEAGPGQIPGDQGAMNPYTGLSNADPANSSQATPQDVPYGSTATLDGVPADATGAGSSATLAAQQAPADAYGGFGSDTVKGKIFKIANDIEGAYAQDGSIHTGMVQAVKDQMAASKDHLHSALSEAGGILLSGGSPAMAQESLNAAKAVVDMEAKFAAAQANAYSQSASILASLLAQGNAEVAQKLQEDTFTHNQQVHKDNLLAQQKQGVIQALIQVLGPDGKGLDSKTLEKVMAFLSGNTQASDEEVAAWFSHPEGEFEFGPNAKAKYGDIGVEAAKKLMLKYYAELDPPAPPPSDEAMEAWLKT